MQASELPDDALEALGNAERRRILVLLSDGPLSVGQLATRFEISRPAVSRHLRVLEGARLVSHKPSGARNIYRLDTAGLASTATWLNDFWDNAERRLRLLAENLPEEPGNV